MDVDDATGSIDAASGASRRAQESAEELLPQTRVGEYVVRAKLGEGGCAQVFEAHHSLLGRRVAIKVLNRALASSPEMVQRFIREAQVVHRVHHPNIADVNDFGALPDGRPFYVMEFLDGLSLARMVVDRGRIPPSEVLEYFDPLCRALNAAHEVGVVHRDVKGSNVMVVQAGGARLVKLLDFGIAKLLQPAPGEQGLTTENQRLGSPPSMAPEQILGLAVDARTDVYALGVLLHHLLTGLYPLFSRDVLEQYRLHLEAVPPRPSALAPLSPAIDAVVLKCLAKEPERRFSGTLELLEALRSAIDEAPGVGRAPGSAAPRTARGCALHLSIHLRETASDEALEQACRFIEVAEGATSQAGLAAFLSTSASLLAVRSLPDERGEARAVLQSLEALARGLYERSTREVPAEAGPVTVLLHVDDADIKLGAGGVSVLGGALVNTAGWPISADQGWYLTRDVLALLAS